MANIGRAIPSFAIVALVLPLSIRFGFGLGFWPTTVALVALGIPPIFTNTYTGVAGTPPEGNAIPEGQRNATLAKLGGAMRRVGMSLPEILAGLRIAATTTVGLATLAFFAGAGGLGEQIFADIIFKSNVVTAGGLAVLLAAALDAVILLVQRAVTPWTRARAA